MAITTSDFKRPKGRLDPGWFTDLDTTLTSLISEAQAKSTSEPAQTAWVYYRAYNMLADDIMAIPASRSVGGVSESYAPQQLLYWRRLADGSLAAYGAAIGGRIRPGVTPVIPVW